jgi:mRNA interferase HicA
MKKQDLVAQLTRHGCNFVREGGNQSWWGDRASAKRSAIPRHTEISDILAAKICKDLGVDPRG